MGARSRVRAAVLAVSTALILSGCATTPKGAGADPSLAFFPRPPDLPRLQFLMAITSDADIPGSRRGFVGRLTGSSPLRSLLRPHGVAVRDGIIYVADAGLATVVKIDLVAKTFEQAVDPSTSPLAGPLGLTVSEDGVIYVADGVLRHVKAFSAEDGRFLRAFGEPEEIRPTDVAVVGDRLFVTDAQDHEIEVFDRQTGERLARMGRESEEPLLLMYPAFIDAGADGLLYVTDSMNFRVVKLSQDGEILGSFGKAGDWTGSFARPKGVAVDGDGRVHVLDAGFENAQIFLEGGEAATAYGGFGNFPGHMYLPFEVTLDTSLLGYFRERIDPRLAPDYLVFVTNQAGPHKLNIYAFGEPVEQGVNVPGG
ncbi:MAG: hypothetical protein OEQ13_04135 [Acidobacteriota bacterium]|nr:hypothetical protein [Acidobacteriota bacterium]